MRRYWKVGASTLIPTNVWAHDASIILKNIDCPISTVQFPVSISYSMTYCKVSEISTSKHLSTRDQASKIAIDCIA
jgi:hypothetical protein